MVRSEIVIINKLGLHARAAAKFVKMASRFRCDIQLVQGTKNVNGKSILGVMMLAASQGSTLELITDGSDEVEAVETLVELVNQRFGEEE